MRRGLLLLVAGGVSAALHVPAAAVPWRPGESEVRPAAPDGFELLERAALAADHLSYRGTQIVSFWSGTGSTSAVIDVVHVAGDGLLVRVAPTPQNPGGAVYNDEGGDLPDVVGFAKGTLALLADHYEAGVESTGEVAGRRADIVAVRRPGSSPRARFWIDRATALPLRREVLDEAGRTIRESAFIDLTVEDTRVAESVQDDARNAPVAAGQPMAPGDLEWLRREGWVVPDRLGEDLELFDARLLGEGDERTLQVSYSDGLSSASVFQQRGRLDTDAMDGWQRERVGDHDAWVQGAFPRRVVWSGDGIVFTVVADCPQATLDGLVGALPHGEPGPGLRTRLGNGLGRIGSWLNPFA
jgi:sigma-E factor negative regulatory protein RseB